MIIHSPAAFNRQINCNDILLSLSNARAKSEDVVEISDSGSANGDPSESDGSLFSRSPSAEQEVGEERWRMSEPPQEAFDDGEWKFQIIGEEVDHNGEVVYEVEWEDWNREDGSNTTWETAQTISDIKWRPAQQKLRNDIAAKSLSVDVMTTTDIHNIETFLRNQAYHEKLKRYSKEKKTNNFNDMAKLMAKHQGYDQAATRGPASQSAQGSQGSSSSPLTLRTNQRASMRQQTENSIAGSSSGARASSRLSSRSSVTLISGNVNSSTKSRDHSLPSTSYSSSKPSSSKTLLNGVPPASPTLPSKLTRSSKGKEKEVIPHVSSPEYTPSHDSVPYNHLKASSALSTSSSHASSFSATKKRPSSSSPEHSDSQNSPPFLSPSKNSRKRTRHFIESGSEDEDELDLLPVRELSPFLQSKVTQSSKKAVAPSSSKEDSLARRYKLQQAWTAEARSAGAAPIYLVNDIDDEILPDLDPGFRYIEKTYQFAPGITVPGEEFWTYCTCDICENCRSSTSEADQCDCQCSYEMSAAQADTFGVYTQSGLFAFNVYKGTELCACAEKPEQCPNRVAQIPRKHPIEVFKTATCGWGVRSTKAIERGQVLGIYTGLVITRDAAKALPGDLANYRFDLDGDEPEDGQANEYVLNHELYSVDSRLYGNWTRFINHSCSPNLQIYLVVYNTLPGIGLPYIAFVANQNIPIREELTFDYNPNKLSTVEDDAEPCHCGSSQCRGFLFS
ncbi:hypothetical protein CVT25_012092 [Psilocybe cyanescens]|uniref:SET domain-containing protein n=1 Tax=Psilocybe cyanescens TaxID=93625 RepID=A0A409VMY4_PSICY|nr:hypothetical protein CVT25_012092 [Psilocybe cyanescens]